MDTDFWSWLAGFWEGEGSFGMYGIEHRAHHRMIFSIPQTTSVPLEYIQQQVGFGKVRVRNRGNVRHKPCWEYYVQNVVQCLKIIDGILPYLRFRQEELTTKRDKAKKYMEEMSQRKWLPEDELLLKQLYGSKSAYQLECIFKRKKGAIKSRAWIMGICPKQNTVEFKQRCALGH